MNSDGQIYADFDGTAPEEDKERYLREQFLAEQEEQERALDEVRMRLLEMEREHG